MANHKSAQKRGRQSIARTERNTMIRTNVKTVVRDFRSAVAAGESDKAAGLLKKATRTIRQAASKGVMHKSTASRRVGRLEKALATPS